jgi:hypothetical protein
VPGDHRRDLHVRRSRPAEVGADLCRPAARPGLAELLRPLPSLAETRCVTDGFAFVDVVAAQGVELVLIGIRPASDLGQEAIDLVLGMHPPTVVVVVGSPGDIDVLAPAYVRGAREMRLRETPVPPWN